MLHVFFLLKDDQDHLKKVTKIEETLHTLTKSEPGTIPKDAKATSSSLEAKEDDYVNCVNVMLLPTKDPYKFGLMLLNMLFTKELAFIEL